LTVFNRKGQSVAMSGCQALDDADSRRSRFVQAWRPRRYRRPSPVTPLHAAPTSVFAIVLWECPVCGALPERSARDNPCGVPPLHRATYPANDRFEDPSFDTPNLLTADALEQAPAQCPIATVAIARWLRFGRVCLRPQHQVPFPAAHPLPPSNAASAAERSGCPVGVADVAPC